MKNKQRKNKDWKRLYNENWKLCHEIADLRDGHVCQIPNCGETERLDLDHVFSRQVKVLFFEPDNMGYLCSAHHTHKSFRKGQWVDMMVREICQKRIGDERWDWMMFAARRLCPEFSTVLYQEQVNVYLKEKKAEFLQEDTRRA